MLSDCDKHRLQFKATTLCRADVTVCSDVLRCRCGTCVEPQVKRGSAVPQHETGTNLTNRSGLERSGTSIGRRFLGVYLALTILLLSTAGVASFISSVYTLKAHSGSESGIPRSNQEAGIVQTKTKTTGKSCWDQQTKVLAQKRLAMSSTTSGSESESTFSTTQTPVSAAKKPKKKKNVGSTATGDLVHNLQSRKCDVEKCLRKNNFQGAVNVAKAMLSAMKHAVERESTISGEDPSVSTRLNAGSVIVDETIRAITDRAFSPPFGGLHSVERVQLGTELLQQQISTKSLLSPPYNSVPLVVTKHALRALASLRKRDVDRFKSLTNTPFDNAHASFRMLQRLVSGHGIRYADGVLGPTLDERDFSAVLNLFSNAGRMKTARRIATLQERTEHAPPLSAVAYSILVKGYGRLGDVENVENILSRSCSNGIEPDIVMFNSIIDAYVNCGLINRAQQLFRSLSSVDSGGDHPEGGETTAADRLFSRSTAARLRPNVRTYNIVLKGFAQNGDLPKALELSSEMRSAGMWNDVTTNTLVNAAVTAGEFGAAEKILTNCTLATDDPDDTNGNRPRGGGGNRRRRHPNVEAYTELLDGYGKAGMLDKALETLRLMRERGVEPNEVTYTCMIGALAREKKVDAAKRMLLFMESKGIRAGTITYNSFITGLVSNPPEASTTGQEEEEGVETAGGGESYDALVDEALGLLGRMISAKIPPNVVTTAAIVEALGHCRPPRVAEAQSIVAKLISDGYIPGGNAMVATSLIRTCGRADDLDGSTRAFRDINEPDVVALNAFLDTCCRRGREKIAFDAFREFVGTKGSDDGTTTRIEPDVVTYSVLISALLRMSTATAARRARLLYREMRTRRGLLPDIVLVDNILTAMISGGTMGLDENDIKFTIDVLRDAEGLDWERGQYRRRLRAVRGVMVGRMSEVWKENAAEYGLEAPSDGGDNEDDELFRRKGWNKVDSGFRFWGGGGVGDRREDEVRESWWDGTKTGGSDDFLESKGWNDVDSGFRIL